MEPRTTLKEIEYLCQQYSQKAKAIEHNELEACMLLRNAETWERTTAEGSDAQIREWTLKNDPDNSSKAKAAMRTAYNETLQQELVSITQQIKSFASTL